MALGLAAQGGIMASGVLGHGIEPNILDLHAHACYGVHMADMFKDRVVRVFATDEQWKALRRLALDRDQEIRELVTTALQTSPITKAVFK